MREAEAQVIRERIGTLESQVQQLSDLLHDIQSRLSHLEGIRVTEIENKMSSEYQRITSDMFDSLRSMARSAMDALKDGIVRDVRQIVQEFMWVHERDRHP